MFGLAIVRRSEILPKVCIILARRFTFEMVIFFCTQLYVKISPSEQQSDDQQAIMISALDLSFLPWTMSIGVFPQNQKFWVYRYPEEPVGTHQYWIFHNPIATKNPIIVPISWGSSFRVSSSFQHCGNMPSSIIRCKSEEYYVQIAELHAIVPINIHVRWMIQQTYHGHYDQLPASPLAYVYSCLTLQVTNSSKDTFPSPGLWCFIWQCQTGLQKHHPKCNWMHRLANRISHDDGCLFTHNALSQLSRHPATTTCWCRIGY